MRTLLDSEDLLEVCDGTSLQPVEGSLLFETKIREWSKSNKIAKKLIVTTVESKPLQLLMSCETACDMWTKLHSVFDMKSEESLSLIQKQFFEFRWDSTSNISQHISKLEQLANKMKKLGGGIPDSMLVTRVLSTLPSKYNHFHSAWDSTDSQKRTLENLTTRLLTEELRLQKQTEQTEETSVALLSKLKLQQGNTKRKFQKSKKTSGCFTCGKMDHFRRDCPGCFSCGSKEHLSNNCTKKNGSFKKEHGSKEQQQAFIGSAGIDIGSYDNWLIDSGASDHMSSKRDWFCEFRQFVEPLKV
jgi:hypothetical protein